MTLPPRKHLETEESAAMNVCVCGLEACCIKHSRSEWKSAIGERAHLRSNYQFIGHAQFATYTFHIYTYRELSPELFV